MATIRRALDPGVTLMDTADAYGIGHNEVLVGRAIVGCRDEVRLATKVAMDFTTGRGKVAIRNDPDYIKAAADASLLRLGTDHIDLYYLHRVNPQVPLSDSAGALAELVQEGKVRHISDDAAAANQVITDEVRTIAEAKGVTAGQVAIAWVAAQGARLGIPVIPIPGTKRAKWIEQNAAALDIQLTADDLAALDPLAAQVAGARY